MASLDQIRARGERDLDQTLKGLSRRHRKRIRAAILKYGSIEAIPGTFWLEIQKEIEDEAAVILVLIFAAAHVSTQDWLGFRREPYEVALDASEFATRRSRELGSLFTQTTRERLRVAQAKARTALDLERAGKIPPEPIKSADLADQMQDQIETILSDQRAEGAAVTETTGGISGGQMGGAGDYERETPGSNVEMYWQTEEDELVCPICFPLNDKPKAVWSQQFPSGPAAHVNCRCQLRLAAMYRPRTGPAYTRGPIPARKSVDRGFGTLSELQREIAKRRFEP